MRLQEVIWEKFRTTKKSTRIIDRLKHSTPIISTSADIDSSSLHGKVLHIFSKKIDLANHLENFCHNYDFNFAVNILDHNNISFLCEHLRQEASIISEIILVLEKEIELKKAKEQQQKETTDLPEDKTLNDRC